MFFFKRFSIAFLIGFLLLIGSVQLSAEEIKININTATVEELSAGLKNVGPKYAAAIVAYRESVGPFTSPEEIKKIKGIGDKTFEENKEIIVVKE